MSQQPLPRTQAAGAVARCVLRCCVLLAHGHVRLPREWVGTRIRFADGTTGRVYRETVVSPQPADPCVLAVAFRLRWVRGFGHRLFEWESLLNTPLFVGFPGFGTKLWLAHDEHGAYRGLYEWDGAALAESYARALWRVLELVSEAGSIHYTILPGLRRADVFADVAGQEARLVVAAASGRSGGADGIGTDSEAAAWWQVVEVR